MLTIGQAARAAGRSKSTVWRDIKSGKVSATRNSNGTVSIDPAELARVYSEPSGNGSGDGATKPAGTALGTVLEGENALLARTAG
jgi:hypothetical protein